MLLKRSDIACFMANWNPKAENLEAIARQLNIGIDSLVFVDDNPVERAHIRDALPLVAVPELPADPSFFVRTVAAAGYFETIAFTKEDQERVDQYAANAERDAMQGAAGDMDSFLQQLEMTVVYGPITPLHLSRVTQLINKTNQFNNTTIRRTEHEIKALMANSRAILSQFRLIDKFGDNGIVSVVLAVPVEAEPDTLDISSWVMSCRVFGRQLEDEAMNILVEICRDKGVQKLRADYLPTAKNAVVKDLFSALGFSPEPLPGGAEGGSRWSLPIETYLARPTRIARKKSIDD
jgi:FkbH-like protein